MQYANIPKISEGSANAILTLESRLSPPDSEDGIAFGVIAVSCWVSSGSSSGAAVAVSVAGLGVIVSDEAVVEGLSALLESKSCRVNIISWVLYGNGIQRAYKMNEKSVNIERRLLIHTRSYPAFLILYLVDRGW